MDPRQLIQLASILECGSLSKASQILHLTQPTLTHSMQALELHAGGQLFERSRFGVRSTALGEVLAREGRAIARHMRDADEACARHRTGFRHSIRLGTGPLVGMAFVPGLVAALSAVEPRYALTIQSDRPHLLVDQLVDGRQDFVIAPSWLDKPPPGVERFLLVEDEIGIFCGRDHPLVQAGGLAQARGLDLEWVSLGTASPFDQNVREMLQQAGLDKARPGITLVGDASILLRILAQGRHLSVLPKFPLRLLGAGSGLRELEVAAPSMPRPIYLWCRTESLEDASLVRLKDLILEHAASTAGVADTGR
ncbi:MAG: LysR family transcriptional regulator [Hylemonella sp.]|nr:LysR family transcriptional regulator [Hylemonella sp.]